MPTTARRRLAIVSVVTMIAAFGLLNVGFGANARSEGDLAQAGIEREGDIPLPCASA